ncbi:MAG: ABC-type transporter Mla maintaining outer membrane lipid asymmetry permease subunit MlaE [Sulfurimonas sp.]|jgi:ABC-type transporter Mla maintaining outer membrane lipid asymmetry permease subunit MlaE|uniref:ABC transporter permease n=1 Tax=Sulfurimonas sp. TaxID=2022749 RepID=UPI0039E61F0B
MIVHFIENIGAKVLNITLSFYNIIVFSLLSFLNIATPNNYTFKIKKKLILQLYRTTLFTLSRFSLLAFLLGSIVVGVFIIVAGEYNFHLQIGSLIVNFIVNVFAPVFTAFYILNKSKILLKKKDYESTLIPYALSSLVSTLSLSMLFASIVLTSSYFPIFFFMHMDVDTYKQLVFESIEFQDILTLFIKSILYGLIIVILPIYGRLQSYNTLSIMRRIIFSIFFIELVSLLIQSSFE